jgi:hypothetical protein
MSKRHVLVFAFLAMFFIAAPILLAQDPGAVDPDFPFELNDSIVVAIQTIFGLGLMAITQLAKAALKKIFKDWDSWRPMARHGIMYFVTAIIAAGATYFTLTKMGIMDSGRMVLYSVYTWGYMNQFWKALKDVVKKHS